MNERYWPMLAVRGEPFDSAEHLFEVKWNGIRALAARHTQGWDLWGRELADYRSRYPEMQVLAALPPGTIVDGELVICSKGLPDLEAMLARHHLCQSAKIQYASRYQPVTYPTKPWGRILRTPCLLVRRSGPQHVRNTEAGSSGSQWCGH